ncbi:hypothetical protein [Streptomyces sp. NPDC051162]|uniref:hypothetical protein n=1 Tax=Streptomyces sp. NPDC051162 TaxID=3154747 RepID=UPI00342AEBBD
MSSSITARTTRRRTLRVAAATLVAAAALTLTACSGSADAGAKPAAGRADTSVAATEAGGTGPTAGAGAQGSGARTGSEAKTNTGDKAGNKASTASKQSGSAHPGTAKAASPVHTEPLPDGSKAEIHELGAQHYLAKIVHQGSVLATLEANEHDAGLDANDMFVVLTPDGRIHSWMGGGHNGPGTFELAGGWTAKVTKTGELRYRAEIIGEEGSVDGTLEANEHDAGLDANGVYIVLSAGGVISAHL